MLFIPIQLLLQTTITVTMVMVVAVVVRKERVMIGTKTRPENPVPPLHHPPLHHHLVLVQQQEVKSVNPPDLGHNQDHQQQQGVVVGQVSREMPEIEIIGKLPTN